MYIRDDKMANEKLQKIGKELNISERNIKEIRKEKIKKEVLYLISMTSIFLLSIILGFFTGKRAGQIQNANTYPFYVAYILSSKSSKKGNNFLKHLIPTLLLSLIGFFVAYIVGNFGEAILYNVYKR